MSNIGLTEAECLEIAQETKMKNITVTFTGDMATGKTRFMEALAQLLRKEGVQVLDVRSRSENGGPHEFTITSEDALRFADERGF